MPDDSVVADDHDRDLVAVGGWARMAKAWHFVRPERVVDYGTGAAA
jgi:hypothetical protein